jgi:hypothetical protein
MWPSSVRVTDSLDIYHSTTAIAISKWVNGCDLLQGDQMYALFLIEVVLRCIVLDGAVLNTAILTGR